MPSPKGKVPWQLTAGLLRRRQYPRREPKPIAEQLPSLTANEIAQAIPRERGIVRRQAFNSPRHHMIGLELTCEAVKITHPTGHTQTLRLRTIRTGFGGFSKPRCHFICETCGRGCLKLYNVANDLGCRRCKRVITLSQGLNKRTRPILRAHRIETFVALKTNMYRQTRDRLLKRYGEKALRPQSNYSTRGPRHWR